MNAPLPRSAMEPARDQVVTSSDLVRHFGVWQDRAARAPVYVLQRGRPRFVLTTIDVMEALCAPAADAPAAPDEGMALVDAVSDLLVVADTDLRVRRANQAARAYFGDAAAAGAPVEQLTSSEAGAVLVEAIRRVAESGLPEALELPSPTYGSRILQFAVSPHAGGVLVTAHDATLAADLAEARARDDAHRQALAAMQDMAAACINLRGYVERPDVLLAGLTGLPAEALTSVRFVSLLDVSSRVAVAEAIEAVIADGQPRAEQALLLVNRGSPVPVRIGLAALRQGAAVRAVTALIARTGA